MRKFRNFSGKKKSQSSSNSDSQNILSDNKSNDINRKRLVSLNRDFYNKANNKKITDTTNDNKNTNDYNRLRLDSNSDFSNHPKEKNFEAINYLTQSNIINEYENQFDNCSDNTSIVKKQIKQYQDDNVREGISIDGNFSNGKCYSNVKSCKVFKKNKSVENFCEPNGSNSNRDSNSKVDQNRKMHKKARAPKFSIKQFEPDILQTRANQSILQQQYHGTRNLNNSQNSSLTERNNDNSCCLSQEEAAIRLRLKWFEIGPIQKYKLVKNKPYKLIIQIFKIILVTTLVMVFAFSLNRLVLFKKNVSRLAENFFVIDDVQVTANTWGDNDEESIDRAPYEKSYRIYQKDVLLNQIKHIYYKFSTIKDPSSLFEMNYTDNSSFNICMNIYQLEYINSKLIISTYDDWYHFNNTSGIDEFFNNTILNNSVEFINSIKINFNIMMKNTFEIITGRDVDYCFNSSYSFYFDNKKNNGEINFSIDSNNVDYLCDGVDNSFSFHDSCNKKTDNNFTYRSAIAGPLVLNLIVVGLVLISMGTCIRSLITHVALMRDTKRYFIKEYNIKLNFWERATFFDLWILLILFSDILALLGTVSKFMDDFLIAHTHDISSIFLGLSCLTVWFGLLRFLTFLPSYNGLLVVLRLSALTVLRVICCMLFIFVGFIICGYLAFGPYHSKFKTLFETSECLFSLMNGDAIFATFEMIEGESPIIVIFCNIYLAVFNVIFIYCVVSIFIATVCHYQEYKQVYINKYENNNRVIKFIRSCDCNHCSLSQIKNIYQRHMEHSIMPSPIITNDTGLAVTGSVSNPPIYHDPLKSIVKDIRYNDL